MQCVATVAEGARGEGVDVLVVGVLAGDWVGTEARGCSEDGGELEAGEGAHDGAGGWALRLVLWVIEVWTENPEAA